MKEHILRLTVTKRLRYASPKFAIANFFYPQDVRQNAHFGAKYKTKDNRYLSKERMKNDGNDLVF